MTYSTSNEREDFSSIVVKTINARLLHEVLSEKIVEDIAVAAHARYWETVKEKGAELADQGLEPLFLARTQVEPMWIGRWIWDRSCRADTPKPAAAAPSWSSRCPDPQA